MFQTSCLVTSSTPRQFDSLEYQSSNLDHEISVKICPPFTNSSQVNVPSWFISMDEKISLARILGSPDGLLPIPSNILYRDWKVLSFSSLYFSSFYRHHINHLVLINLSRIVFIIYLKCPPVFLFFSLFNDVRNKNATYSSFCSVVLAERRRRAWWNSLKSR